MTTTARTIARFVGAGLLVPALSFTGSAHADVATEKSGGRGIQGEVTFDCLLEPFKSAFRYEGAISVQAPKATSEDAPVSLVATMPELPGIAPVAIENGTMRVSLKGKMGDEKFKLTGSRTVNAGANEDVAVPEMTGEVPAAASGDISVTNFTFEFDEMMGLVIDADCDPSKGASMGAMKTVGAAAATPKAKAEQVEEAAADDEGMPMALLVSVPVALLAVGAGAFALRGRTQRRA